MLPSTLTMRSPGLMPARSAALPAIDRLRDRQDVRPADQREDRREDDDGEDEIRERTGRHDGDALPQRREMEEARAARDSGVAASTSGSGMLAALSSPSKRT